MKRTDIYTVILFTLIVSFSFLSLSVIGQTDSSSSSSSSSGDITSVTLNPNFTGNWKAKIKERPQGSSSTSTSSSSSSTSSSGECIVCTQVVPECLSSQTLVLQTCTECAKCVDIAPASSNRTPARVLAHLDEAGKGGNIITFKLCVKDGKLEGSVHQGRAFITGKITSQTVISPDEIEFIAESKDRKTAMIHLKLTGKRQFMGTFADTHTFEGRKLNENKGCLVPVGNSSGTMGGKPSMGRPR